MSEFDELLESGLELMLGPLGTPAVYATAEGAGTALTLVAEPERTEEIDDFDGRRQRRTRRVTIAAADVAAPALNATVTIGGVEYSIEAIDERSEAHTVCRLVRRTAVEVSRPHYRKR